MSSSKDVNDLPDELLVQIFSNFTFEELTLSVQHVSLRWGAVAQDDELWRDLVYAPEKETSDLNICHMLRQTPKLQTIILKRGVKSAVLNSIIFNCPFLKRLDLSANQKFSKLLLKNLVTKCMYIEYLSIPENVLDKWDTAKVIGECHNLKTIKLSDWRDSNVPLVLQPIADGCPSLQSIDLRNQMHTNKDLEYLLKRKKHQLVALYVRWSSEPGKCTLPLLEVCTALETLHVDDYCEVSIDAGFQALRKLTTVKFLSLLYFENANINNMLSLFQNKTMSQLVELDINCYDNYDDVLANVIIRNCPLLQRICLKRCYNLTDNSLVNIHTVSNLKHLNLTGCRNITDAGVAHIAKCLKLKYLNLCSCDQLTEQSMHLLLTFSNLQVLKLNSCTVAGLPFHLIPTQLKHLLVLSLKYCDQLDHVSLKQLRLQMPHLKIKVSYEYFPEEEDQEDILEEEETSSDISLENSAFLFRHPEDST